MAVTNELWSEALSLPLDYWPKPWENLILDAFDILDEIGPAIVLAAAAVETRAATALDFLARSGAFDVTLWEWITDRAGDYRKEPSVSEQLDNLMLALGGASLKADARLWAGHKNLRAARNAFVHEGVPRIGGNPVTRPQANELVSLASEVIDWIDQRLPLVERRPTPHVGTTIESTVMVFAADVSADTVPGEID